MPVRCGRISRTRTSDQRSIRTTAIRVAETMAVLDSSSCTLIAQFSRRFRMRPCCIREIRNSPVESSMRWAAAILI